jgi:hypothetical protein
MPRRLERGAGHRPLVCRVEPCPAVEGPELLGRVFGVRRAVSAAAVPLGAAGGGLLLDRLPPTTVIGASAALCILGGGAALCVPALHRLPARPRRTAAQRG